MDSSKLHEPFPRIDALAARTDLEFYFKVAFKIMHRVAVILEDAAGAERNDILGIVDGKSFPPRRGWFKTFGCVEANSDYR